jgi:hypothetical protein
VPAVQLGKLQHVMGQRIPVESLVSGKRDSSIYAVYAVPLEKSVAGSFNFFFGGERETIEELGFRSNMDPNERLFVLHYFALEAPSTQPQTGAERWSVAYEYLAPVINMKAPKGGKGTWCSWFITLA